MDRNEVAKAVVGGAADSTTAFQDVGVVKRRVTGDSLSTDHSIDPPVWSGRSRGRFNPSNLPTAPAHGDRRDRPVRRLRTLSLPALGVAAGLLAVFLALPAPRAHAQAPALVEVWSATMTAGTIASSRTDPDVTFTTHGYDPDRGARALGRISADRFELNGMDYVVSHLAYWTRSGSTVSPAHQQLSILAGNELPTGAVFDLGGTRFPVTNDSRYYSATPGRHEWEHPGLNWSDGDEVTVRLLVPVMAAEAIEAPAFHDGSSVFRVRVRFSGTLKNSAEEVARAFAAEITGGTVTEARCAWRAVNVGAEEWDLFIAPDGNDPVVLALPTGGQCHVPGQLCSKDELKVGSWVHEVRGGAWIAEWTGRTIPFLRDGVIASVVDSPGRHDGSSAFNVRIRFNTALRNSYLRVVRAFEGTTGGTVVRTRPVERRDGTRDGSLWDITVQPDGTGDVTLALNTGGPCRQLAQPCSKDWKWITAARDFPLTISGHSEPTGRKGSGRRAFSRLSLSWTLRAGGR